MTRERPKVYPDLAVATSDFGASGGAAVVDGGGVRGTAVPVLRPDDSEVGGGGVNFTAEASDC